MTKTYTGVIRCTPLISMVLFHNYKSVVKFILIIVKHKHLIAAVVRSATRIFKILSLDYLKLMFAHPEAFRHLLWSNSFDGMMELLLQIQWWWVHLVINSSTRIQRCGYFGTHTLFFKA